MKTAENIRKLGFKRWHERALMESHAYLVISILGMIVSFAGMEMILGRETAMRSLIGLAVTAVGAIVTVVGFQRYARMMVLVHRLSDRATCERCGLYAAFSLLAAGPRTADREDDAENLASIWLKVKCRQCGNQWTI